MRSLAVQNLHEAGVYHGQLYERGDALCVSDGRHFLRAESGEIRIVDFHRARIHQCEGNHEDSDDNETNGRLHVDGSCKELMDAMEHYRGACASERGLKDIDWNAY